MNNGKNAHKPHLALSAFAHVLVREKWVWEFHPKVEHADRAVNSGFGRLEKLVKMVQSFCEKGRMPSASMR